MAQSTLVAALFISTLALLLLCWEGVLCHTHYHFMLILPSQFNQLHHTFWVCTRSWNVFYLQHHYSVLARWLFARYKYHSCQRSWVDHVWRVFLREQSNSCLQWVCWAIASQTWSASNRFVGIYILQQGIYVTPPSLPSMRIANNVHAALLLQFTQYTELANCSFHHNIGTALVVNNTNIILADMNFGQNCVLHRRDDTLGGGGITSFFLFVCFFVYNNLAKGKDT